MPTSKPLALNHICNYILNQQPRRVLDIGIGFGKWGFLAREYTDIWQQRIKPPQWRTTIHGVEAYAEYITPASSYVYDDIFIGNAIEIIKTLDRYQLIICVAMLEHLEKNQGLAFLSDCKQKADVCFFALPVATSLKAGRHNPNPYERHKSQWKREELAQFGKVTVLKTQFMLEIRDV